MTAYGYVRKSVMRDGDKTLSPQLQEDRIRALARAHGDNDLVILSDLDVSGAKVEQRVEYMRMVDAIQSGDAERVYAYDLSRLHRNVREALRFFELADAHKVTVRLVMDNVDTSTATGRMVLTILSAVNAMLSQVTSEKLIATFKMKRERGDALGGRPYGETRVRQNPDGTTTTFGLGEDASAVVEMLRSTGSPMRAAKALNEAGIRTRNDKSQGWSANAVKAVARRLEPALMLEPADVKAPGSRRGERAQRYARLLRCSVCGSMMTALTDSRHTQVRYTCHNGSTVAGHARRTVDERAITLALQSETDRAVQRVQRLGKGSVDDTEALARIEAEREVINRQERKGRITEAEADAAIADLDEQAARLTAVTWMRRLPIPPALDDAPADVNAYLRRLFTKVVVDMAVPGRGSKTPALVEAVWRDPALRDAIFTYEYEVDGQVGHMARPTINLRDRTLDYEERLGELPLDRRSIEETQATDPEYAAVLRAEAEGAPAGTTRRSRKGQA